MINDNVLACRPGQWITAGITVTLSFIQGFKLWPGRWLA